MKVFLPFFAARIVAFSLPWSTLGIISCFLGTGIASPKIAQSTNTQTPIGKPIPLTYQILVKETFSIRESNELILELKKDPKAFALYLQTKPKSFQLKVKRLLEKTNHSHMVSGLFKDSTTQPTNNWKTKKKPENIDRVTNFVPKMVERPSQKDLNLEPFAGASYQTNSQEEVYSSIYGGASYGSHKWILEKRGEQISGSLSWKGDSFFFMAGNRYKPLPHFYFAKDPNYYSAFDRRDSHLPQPIQESAFAGLNPSTPLGKLAWGLYYAPTVTREPGIFFTSPNQSYSVTWEPKTGVSSAFLNDTWSKDSWKANVQGEGFGTRDSFFGFLYGKLNSDKTPLVLDGTVYRDSKNLLSGSVLETLDNDTVKKHLQYGRARFKDYFVLEGLQSKEGIRLDQGAGFWVPFLFGDWGAIVGRYRMYEELGVVKNQWVGQGIFYEWRKDKTVFSIGTENQNGSLQWEGKGSMRFDKGFFVEVSLLARDPGRGPRSWFENWSFATDFNMNLTERSEIGKVKMGSQEFSLNISLTRPKDSEQYFYYGNFQALLVF